MRIEELIQKSGSPMELKARMENAKKPFPFDTTLEKIINEWNPTKHNVMDEIARKDKKVKVNTGKKDENGNDIYDIKTLKVCRCAVPIQQILVERSVGFLLSNPVEYKVNTANTESKQKLADAVLDVFYDNKIDYFDKKLVRSVFRGRESAELWYFVPDVNGRPTSELKVRLLSPLLGDTLYPHFDDYDRLDGFGRYYMVRDEYGTEVIHFDVYTQSSVYRYQGNLNGSFEAFTPLPHGFDRLPIVYYRQEETEWEKVQPLIDRVETLMSNWGDTNDYFGSPSLYVRGELKGFADKGEQGKVYQGKGDSDMRVLSWDNSPTSISQELAHLMNDIYSLTQTPDISFEVMKTLGSNTSGAALRLMFTDPHMKARVKEELFGEMFTRRYNIVKSAVGVMGAFKQSDIDELKATPVFHPYMPKNETELIQQIATAKNADIITQETAVRKNPLIDNPDEEVARMQEIAEQQAIMGAFEPTE